MTTLVIPKFHVFISNQTGISQYIPPRAEQSLKQTGQTKNKALIPSSRQTAILETSGFHPAVTVYLYKAAES